MASYNHTSYSQIKHNPDHVYYDMVVRNYDSPSKDSEIQLSFSDTRDTPIVANANDYYLSIIRFQVDTFADVIPVLIFQVQNNQGDRDLGIYTLTLEYDNGAGLVVSTQPENVIWSPQEKNASVPPPPSLTGTGFQRFGDYYYCYNFQYMINLINEAFIRAMDKLKLLVAPVLDFIEPPFLDWNDDQTATIYARESHFDSDVFPQVRIYFNRPLYSLLSSLPSIKFNITNPRKKYYQILMKRYYGAKVVTLPDFGIDQLIFSKQEYSTVNQWTPISSLIFTSSVLPIIPNALSNPVIYLDGTPLNLSQTYNNYANIITDISSDELAYKPEVLYVPSAQYRLIDLQNDQPINQIDIQVYWRDKLGFLRAFYLAPNSSCSIKLAFIKKSVYGNGGGKLMLK